MTNEFKSILPSGGVSSMFLALLLSLLFAYCDPPPVSPLVVINGPIKAPQGVAFIDANGDTSNVENVKVTLLDAGGMVVSSNGVPFRTVEVTDGVMSIGLAKKATFSAAEPYRFFIRAEAEGYKTTVKTIIITADVPNFIPIFMAKLGSLPVSGLVASVGDIVGLQNGVLQNTETIQAVPTGGQLTPVSIVLPQQMWFLREGKRIETAGPLRFRMLYGAPRDSNANRVFPGGFEVSDAFDIAGNRIADPANPLYFSTAGWISLEMNIGQSAIDSFSTPLEVEMPIDPTTINPQTNDRVTFGDKIPLWSMDDNTGIWKSEGTAVVEGAQQGGMSIQFRISHLSTFNAAWTSPMCSSGTARIDVTYPYDPANVRGFGGLRYARLENRVNGAELKARLVDFSSGVDANSSNSILEMVGLPSLPNMQLVVHKGATFMEPIQGFTGNLSCPGSGVLGLPGSTPSDCICLEFMSTLGNAEAPIAVQCNNSVWTKTCTSSSPFTFAGIINQDGNMWVPNASGNRCVRLWFLNDTTGSKQVYLDFPINLGIPVFSTGGTTNTTWITAKTIPSLPAIPPSTMSASYWKETVTPSASQPCGTRIRIMIPSALISGNSCAQ